MKICPECGAKEFAAEHRGSVKHEHCKDCGGDMKMNMPKMPKKPMMPKMPPKNMPMNPMGALPNSKAPLGQGGRFAALAAKTSPAIAAMAGRKKYGAKKMAGMAAAGKKKSFY